MKRQSQRNKRRGAAAGKTAASLLLAGSVLLGAVPLPAAAGAQAAQGTAADQSAEASGQGAELGRHKEKLALIDQGSSVTLKNSRVSVTIDKGSATVTSITYGEDSPNLLAGGGAGYYILNYSQNGKNLKFGPKDELTYKVVAQDEEHIDIALTVDDRAVLPFSYELHFVLVKNEPGLYFYSVVGYPEAVEGGVTIGQGRYAFRVDPDLFDSYAVDDERRGPLPAPAELEAGEEVMDASIKLPSGEVYTKYNHIEYAGDLNVTGLYGKDLGIWLIRGSNEFVDGGPTQQRNSVHQTNTTPILLWHEHESHYGRGNVVPSPGWKKIYGPSFLYVNQGGNADKLWKDANRRAEAEQRKWPYRWLDDPLYAADRRGSVKGQLTIADGRPAADAWVILADSSPDWQDQNLGYNYYIRTDSQGRFTIPDVREGTYTLYSFVKGYFGEFRKDGITVQASKETKLPALEWTPETHGTTLWTLGTPDRTAGEYRHGDDYHHWGLWLDYPLDFPNGVDFRMGESSERTDWNYAHPVTATPGEPAQLKVPFNPELTPWKIRFDSDAVYPAGTKATLTFGIASSRNGSLRLNLNGTEIANLASLPGPKSDSGMPRSAVHAFYREFTVEFDASLLKQGENVLQLTHAKNIYDANGQRTGDLYTSQMYDAIRLEVQQP
ncbi:polysaccharide lyase family protein [Paenibacillus mucilaginosus]|uniref:rhamnogalacturonan endolyase n=1 Tax=Paenibacillus mucilaginosus (strain KNP414) TaxID=1036673 RepID=F8FLG2_PAEMK|nr:polysaccharide lyase family protein [Paenibacillus mucilaginosus]AEI43530.1 lyase [Paenibacillus mucilaginosus KNP414]MCG7211929.1 carboxypeptidase regulatory-like domain-containing protein [Paenibacillus mucilaginosus]WDM25077.1 carboxypeptidase regulatory-like domain-containing protein [Paenibacillus mucilaginosus]